MSTIVPGFGDDFPKLLLVAGPEEEPRLLRALHGFGVAAHESGREGQKLFGARITADPAREWPALARWVRAVVVFGNAEWQVAHPPASAHPVTVLACGSLTDPDVTDSMLREVLLTAQDAAGLSWGCGGRAVVR